MATPKHEIDITDANGNGIVFVHDGYHTHGKQFLEGINSIEVSGTLQKVSNRAIKYSESRHTSDMSPRVNSTCAIGCSSCPNRLSHSAMSLPCPIAAKA